jgi:S-formylglutathione hydrolase FrmB
MFRVPFVLLLLSLISCSASLPPGVSREAVRTVMLPRPEEVLVITPPSYDRDRGRRYPVLYFLHDAYGGVDTLARRGVAAELRARMADGRLPEFLVVAPAGRGSWFSDYHDGSRRYEELLASDLPRQVEARYRVLPGRRARGVTGISMGGYGAFKLALKHPALFGSVSSLSGALIPIEWTDLPRYPFIVRFTLKRVFGRSPADNSLTENDVWEILRRARFEKTPFAAHLRAGTEDLYGLDGVAAQFGSFLNQHGVAATVVLEHGRHDWSYWKSGMIAIAQWHARQFEYDGPKLSADSSQLPAGSRVGRP